VLAGELRVGIKPFGLPGHQLIGGTWSTKTFNTLQQDPRLLLVFLGFPIDVPIRQQSGSWSAYYNFDQFLYTTTADGSEGFGIFGWIGVADPHTNPLELFYSVGIGGQGMLAGRARDRFGLGFSYGRLSRDLRGLLLDSSAWGIEIFYNIAVTHWLFVTPDIQVLNRRPNQPAPRSSAGYACRCASKGCLESPCEPSEPLSLGAGHARVVLTKHAQNTMFSGRT
jgi:porin